MSEETPNTPWQELALRELQQQRQALEAEIGELSQRRDQLQQEIQSSFAGQSDAIARRVKGFQDYLVGALQELAVSAEQMELVVQPMVVQPSPLDQAAAEQQAAAAAEQAPTPAAAGLFSADEALWALLCPSVRLTQTTLRSVFRSGFRFWDARGTCFITRPRV